MSFEASHAVRAFRGGLPVHKAAGPQVLSALVAALLGAVALALSVRYSSTSLLTPFAVVVVAGSATWFFFSERRELTLALLMLYLGLLDGYIKLKTGSPKATLGRDVLLYALVLGVLVRATVRRTPIAVPPLAGWVLAWVLVVLVQIFNPANPSIPHALGSARPHLEWVPLFFLGYAAMRSARRLRAFLLLLLLVAAVNGAVSLVQYTLTPEQFAAWGPGYASRISGTGDVAARGFEDAAGETRNRPFGLGSDFGFGGSVGLLAAPAALALLALVRRHRWLTAATIFAAAGTVLAIVMSQARVAVVGSIVAVVAYAALATTARRLVPTLAALGIAVLIGVAVLSHLGTGATQGSFDRYSDITPTRVVGTTVSYRRESLEDLPRYVQEYPLGAGLGKVGPASEFASGAPSDTLNAEGEANYLVLELGLAGLLVLFAFNVRLLLLSGSGIRRVQDPELRLLLSALAAPLLALFAAWLVGVTSATTPTSPYFWFVAGVLAYWLTGRPETVAPPAPAVQPRPHPPAARPARPRAVDRDRAPAAAEAIVAGYRLHKRLRKAPGGGWIHRASRLSDGAVMGLELVDLRRGGAAGATERFAARARARAALQHADVVAVRDVGVPDGQGFLVADLIDGATLEEPLAAGPLAPPRALALLGQVAGGLDAAHAGGIVHGDLAPGSIVVDPSGDRALLDTCAGWCARGPGPGGDAPGPEWQYLAPERITGGQPDASSDVYSLSAVLYRCLTGEVPFPGVSERALLFWHLHAPRPSATARRPELPRAIDAVLRRGMAADPAARHPSARALLDAAGQALGVAPPSPTTHEPTAQPATVRPRRRPRTARRSRRARRSLARAGLVAAIAIGAGVAGFTVAGTLDDSPSGRSSATAGRLQLAVPPGWRSTADPGLLTRIRVADPLVLAPDGDRATSRLVAGTATAEASAALIARLPRSPASGELVLLGGAQARRYRAARLPGLAGTLTVYLVPMEREVATVVCVPADDRVAASFTPRCERVASTLRLRAGRFVPAGPSRRQSAGLARSLKRLNSARSRARALLRRFRTARGQAAAARELATAHARAAREVRSLALTGLGRPGGAAAADALERLSSADRAMAAAADHGARRGYARARRAALEADADLRAARRLLRRLGYGA